MTEFDVTETDRIKHAKIEKAKKFEEDVSVAMMAIPEISEKYDKLVSELCEGPDCLKKQVEDKFGSIDDKIKKIEEKQSDLICDKCGYIGVPALSSYCPNCGAAIYSWNNDDGAPISGWKHYSERNANK